MKFNGFNQLFEAIWWVKGLFNKKSKGFEVPLAFEILDDTMLPLTAERLSWDQAVEAMQAGKLVRQIPALGDTSIIYEFAYRGTEQQLLARSYDYGTNWDESDIAELCFTDLYKYEEVGDEHVILKGSEFIQVLSWEQALESLDKGNIVRRKANTYEYEYEPVDRQLTLSNKQLALLKGLVAIADKVLPNTVYFADADSLYRVGIKVLDGEEITDEDYANIVSARASIVSKSVKIMMDKAVK